MKGRRSYSFSNGEARHIATSEIKKTNHICTYIDFDILKVQEYQNDRLMDCATHDLARINRFRKEKYIR